MTNALAGGPEDAPGSPLTHVMVVIAVNCPGADISPERTRSHNDERRVRAKLPAFRNT